MPGMLDTFTREYLRKKLLQSVPAKAAGLANMTDPNADIPDGLVDSSPDPAPPMVNAPGLGISAPAPKFPVPGAKPDKSPPKPDALRMAEMEIDGRTPEAKAREEASKPPAVTAAVPLDAGRPIDRTAQDIADASKADLFTTAAGQIGAGLSTAAGGISRTSPDLAPYQALINRDHLKELLAKKMAGNQLSQMDPGSTGNQAYMDAAKGAYPGFKIPDGMTAAQAAPLMSLLEKRQSSTDRKEAAKLVLEMKLREAAQKDSDTKARLDLQRRGQDIRHNDLLSIFGQKQLEKAGEDAVGLAGAQRSVQQLDDMLKKESLPGQGYVAGSSLRPDWSKSEDAIKLDDAVRQLANSYIYSKSGKAITENEMKRLLNAYNLDRGVAGNSEAAFRTGGKQLIEDFNAILQGKHAKYRPDIWTQFKAGGGVAPESVPGTRGARPAVTGNGGILPSAIGNNGKRYVVGADGFWHDDDSEGE